MFRRKSSKKPTDRQLAGRNSRTGATEDTITPLPSTLPEATEADRQLVLATQAAIDACKVAATSSASIPVTAPEEKKEEVNHQCRESLGTLRACSNANNADSDWDYYSQLKDQDAELDGAVEFDSHNEAICAVDLTNQLSTLQARRRRKKEEQNMPSSPQVLAWTLRRRVRSLLRFFARTGGGGGGSSSNNHAGKRLSDKNNQSPPPPAPPAGESPNAEGGAEEGDMKTVDGSEEGPATEDKTTAASRGKESAGTQSKQKQQKQAEEKKPEPTPEPTPEAEETPLAKPPKERLYEIHGGPTTECHRRKQEAIFKECRVIPIATLYKKVALVPGRERLFLSAPSNPRTIGSHMLYDIAYENYRHHSDCNRDFTRVGLKKICSNYCRPSQFRYVY